MYSGSISQAEKEGPRNSLALLVNPCAETCSNTRWHGRGEVRGAVSGRVIGIQECSGLGDAEVPFMSPCSPPC